MSATPPAPPRPAPAPRRRARPWRGVLEGAVLLGLLLLADLPLTGGTRFAGFAPNPLGLAVLLVSAQYGMGQGAAVALLAVAARYAGAFPEQAFGQDAAAFLREVARDPLLWLGTALLVGGIAGRLRQRAARAEQAADRTRGELAAMVEANTRLSASLGVLEGKVAGQLRTASAIYEAARELGPDRPAVLRGTPALLRAATECARCSLFLIQGDSLRLAASEGWRAADGLAESIGHGPLFDAIVERRGILVANRAADRAVLGAEGVLAGPVLAPEGGGVLGMLKIEGIGFARLQMDTVSNFQAVCAWVGTALANADGLARAQEQRLTVDEGRLVSARHAEQVTLLVTGLAQRIDFDLSLLSVEMRAAGGEPGGEATVERLGRLLQESFRGSDVLLEARADHRRFSALLPGTDRAGAQVVADRLTAAMSELDARGAAHVAVSCVALHEKRRDGRRAA